MHYLGAIDCFKIAMLCKQLYKLVIEKNQLTDFKIVKIQNDMEQIVNTFKNFNYDKYQKNQKKIMQAYKSTVFGGDIFQPIKGSVSGTGGLKETRNDGRKINRTNNLFSNIEHLEISKFGGFYFFENV